jgi:hypothetical protein
VLHYVQKITRQNGQRRARLKTNVALSKDRCSPSRCSSAETHRVGAQRSCRFFTLSSLQHRHFLVSCRVLPRSRSVPGHWRICRCAATPSIPVRCSTMSDQLTFANDAFREFLTSKRSSLLSLSSQLIPSRSCAPPPPRFRGPCSHPVFCHFFKEGSFAVEADLQNESY